jgi:DsbC/DsbD-like thiol-disulfide interchange protein
MLLQPRSFLGLLLAVLAAGGQLSIGGYRAWAVSVASPAADHHGHASSRLLAGKHGGKLYAFVEIALADGWKTYWRNPGDAGGLPPSFDFSKSTNVAAARVRHPAPQRLSDRAGDTIGYKGRVLFPVEVDVADATQPVSLKLSAHFGVCREICIPVDAEHGLDVAPDAAAEADGDMIAAIARVPQPARDGGLSLLSATPQLDESAPLIVFKASFPDGVEGADLFVEAPEGLYVPMVRRLDASADGTVEFSAAIGTLA